MKILIVDDERWIRKGVVKMVQGQHVQVETILEADGMESAWDIVDKEHPDIVISDVKFPIGNGCLLCEKIHNKYPEIKIIMLSGYDDFAYVKNALKYKAVDYLLKPVDKLVLNEVISNVIDEINRGNRERNDALRQDSVLNSREIVAEIKKEIQDSWWKKLSLSLLSQKYCISASYLSDIFAKYVGVSLVNYQMKIRIEKAKSFLIMTDKSILEISEAVGYEDPRYFTRVFKKITGETPKQYRTSIRAEIDEE